MISFRSFCFRFSVAVMFALPLSAGSQLEAQESYNVGDKIRIEFMRKQVTGTITETLRGGLYKVDLDQGNDRFLPPMTLVQQRKILGKVGAKSAEPKPNSKPATKMGNDPSPEVRTWRDKTGKFEMQGAFVDLVDGNITLKKSDGKELTLPLEKLNPADARLAESLKQAMSEGNPFAGGEVPDNKMGDASSGEADVATNFTVKEMDFSSVKIVKAEIVPEWKVEPAEALPIDIPNDSQLYPIKVAGRRQIIRDTRTPNRIFIGNRMLRERTEEGLVVDLATGKSLGPFTYPMKNVTTIAFDSKSNQLLTATTTGERNRPKTVDVWRINGNDVEHKFGFVPTNQKIVLTVSSGLFLDSDRVLLTIFGKAGIFNLNTMKGETGFQFFNASRVNIGPNGKYLYGRVDDKTVIFDIEAKKTVGSISQLLQITNNFGFNAAMNRAAFTESQRLVIWDLAEDRKIDQVYLPFQVVVGTTPIFLDDENLLLTRSRGAALVNVRLKSPIWSYGGTKFASVPGTDKILAIGKKSGGDVAGFVDMPSKPASELMASLTLDDLIVMPRGSSVSVGNINSSARDGIRNQLEDHGYRVVENAPYEFRTSVSKGEKTTRTYRDVTGGPDETVTMQSEGYELALYHDDEKIWNRTGGGGGNDPGSFVQLNEGESVQSRINKSKGSPEGFFKSLLMPDVFVKTPKGYFHGTTRDLDGLD